MDIMGGGAGKIRQPRQHGNSGRYVRFPRFGDRKRRRCWFCARGFEMRGDLGDAILYRRMCGKEVQPRHGESVSKKQMTRFLGSRVF